MQDAGFVFGCYIVTFGAIAAYALYVVRRGRRATDAAARRRQALDLRHASPDVSTIDLTPAPAPAARPRRTPATLAATPRARAGARGRRGDRHQVPQLGRRLLLQRRRDRPRGGCEVGRAPARPGHGRQGHASPTHEGEHRLRASRSTASRCRSATAGGQGGMFQECTPSSSTARSWTATASVRRRPRSRSSTPTSTRPPTRTGWRHRLRRPAMADVRSRRRDSHASLNGASRPGRPDARRSPRRCSGR